MSAFVGRFRDIFSSRGSTAELIAPRPGGLSIMIAERLKNSLLIKSLSLWVTLYDLGAELQANAGLDL